MRVEKGWAAAALALSVAGCGAGDICSATIADLEGEYVFTFFDDNGDRETRIELTVDGDGEVTADVFEANGTLSGRLTCTTLEDDLCDLHVTCETEDGDRSFEFTLTAKE